MSLIPIAVAVAMISTPVPVSTIPVVTLVAILVVAILVIAVLRERHRCGKRKRTNERKLSSDDQKFLSSFHLSAPPVSDMSLRGGTYRRQAPSLFQHEPLSRP